jgi:hypothetical protein
MNHDLYLQYKFTDRGGNHVYEKYRDTDRMCQKEPLGEIRIKPPVPDILLDTVGKPDDMGQLVVSEDGEMKRVPVGNKDADDK